MFVLDVSSQPTDSLAKLLADKRPLLEPLVKPANHGAAALLFPGSCAQLSRVRQSKIGESDSWVKGLPQRCQPNSLTGRRQPTTGGRGVDQGLPSSQRPARATVELRLSASRNIHVLLGWLLQRPKQTPTNGSHNRTQWPGWCSMFSLDSCNFEPRDRHKGVLLPVPSEVQHTKS